MTTKPSHAPDPLLAELLEEAARVEVDLDLDALERDVDNAVAPYRGMLTDEGLDRTRDLVAVALLSGSKRERFRKRPEGTSSMTQLPGMEDASGTQLKKPSSRLLDAARRRGGGPGGQGA